MRLELIEEDPIRIRVQWNAPEQTHGEIKSYLLIWGERGADDTATKTVSVSSERFSYVCDSMCKYEHRKVFAGSSDIH